MAKGLISILNFVSFRWKEVTMRLTRSRQSLVGLAAVVLQLFAVLTTAADPTSLTSTSTSTSTFQGVGSSDFDDETVSTSSTLGCPRSCECKWKRGKETVTCVNTGFTTIPKPIDAGTQV